LGKEKSKKKHVKKNISKKKKKPAAVNIPRVLEYSIINISLLLFLLNFNKLDEISNSTSAISIDMNMSSSS
jgi:hypothetical protein